MLVVSFYTPLYDSHADRLRESCRAHGLRYWIEAVESNGSWEHNCAMKGTFVQHALANSGESVLWLDADAEVLRPLDDLEALAAVADFAVYQAQDEGPQYRFRSGTVFFNQGARARKLAEEWSALCQRYPDTWDQRHLYDAWHSTTLADEAFDTVWLSMSYCQRFDEPESKGAVDNPHILHWQASRKTKGQTA